jgi:hypothetical protein
MTGFLQRLAERATGAAHPLRRVASTLFALPLVEEMQQPVDAVMAARVDPAPSPIDKVAAKPAQPGRNSAQSVAEKSVRPGEPVIEEAVDHAVMTRNTGGIETTGKISFGQPAGNSPPMLVPRAANTVQSPATETAPKSESLSPAHQDMEAEHRESLRPVPAAPARIELLLPLARPAREPFRTTASANMTNQGRLSSGMVEETTEVHVSIGRIEVTAVHEPAPNKPPAPRRKAPMSLDDYLATRHRGRS